MHSGNGVRQEHIAAMIRGGINVTTLREHFRDELDCGKATANAKIGGRLFEKAMSGDTACLIFWAKTQMGWRETTKHEVTGEAGGPMQIARIERVIVDGPG